MMESGTGKQLHLIENGQAPCTIVIPDDCDDWTRKAAGWLQDFVQQSFGVVLPFVEEHPGLSGTLISVGHTKLARRANIDTSDLKWDACRLTVRENILFLLGRDDVDFAEGWAGSAAHGTCRAVVTFLEEFIGVRWFLPIAEGVRVPRKSSISVPWNLDKTATPAFAFLHGRYPYGVNTPAALANHYRTAIKILSYGGHCYYDWLPASEYFDKHPEYFAMLGGKRTAVGNHLCLSHPDVRNILLKSIQRDFDAGWDWVALGQEDGYTPCECPECGKLDRFTEVMGSSVTRLKPSEQTWKDYLDRFRTAPCERLAATHLWIIDQCAKSHPDKKVHLLVYWPSLIPSAKLDTKRDNLVAEVAFYNDPYELDVIDLWKDKAYAISIMCTWFDLTTGKGTMGVMMTPQEVAARMREYHRRGVVGIYGIHEANWGFQGPCFYVMGRIAGDPSLNEDDLVREYCEGVYGTAGPTMKRFFDLLYTRSISKLGYQWKLREFGTIEDRHLLMYPMDFLRELEGIFSQAEEMARAETTAVRRILVLTRRLLDLLEKTTRLLIAHRAYDANPTPANLNELKETVSAFHAFRRSMLAWEDRFESPWPGQPGNDAAASPRTSWMTPHEQPWPNQSDHDWLRKYLVGNGDDINYYTRWARRKTQLDLDDLDAIDPGFSGTVIRAPFAAVREVKST